MFDETQLNSPLEPDNDHECRLRHRNNRIAIRLARLTISLLLSTIAGIGMWSAVVALPKFKLILVLTAPVRRFPLHSRSAAMHLAER